MSEKKLKNAPLKEVIFELRWECGIDAAGIQTDRGFDLAQGRFALNLEKEFPIHKSVVPENAPFKVFGSPVHQYWKGELTWPVVQHGQGMIAVNDVEESYEWEDKFFPMVIATIDKLVESYELPLKFNRIKLHYIDACDVNEGLPIDFMKNNLQTEIVANYETPGSLRSFSIEQSFLLAEGSLMSLTISSGINNQNKKNSVIWNTVIENDKILTKEDIHTWLDFAHQHTSSMFKQMLNPKFYLSLDS